MPKLSRPLGAIGIFLTAVLGGAMSGPAAGAQPAAMAVGPKQAFVGLVNGHTATATVQVLCPGPARTNQTGRPVTGQTIGVASPAAVATDGLGFTGGRADSIVAEYVPTAAVGATIRETFTVYGNQPIPTSVPLPCTGTSTMVFVPHPRSQTSRATRVTITFEAVCNATVCSAHDRRYVPPGATAGAPA